MQSQLTPVEGLAELDRLVAASNTRPLVLFKHSHSCGISAEALDEIVAHLSEQARDVHYAVITVQTHRDVSNAVTKKLGVRHETPQVLLVQDGRVVWSASHFRVTADAVERALSSVTYK